LKIKLKRFVLPVWVTVEEAVAGVEDIVKLLRRSERIEREFSNRSDLYVKRRSRELPKFGLKSKLKDLIKKLEE
jgi:hypothetical protein